MEAFGGGCIRRATGLLSVTEGRVLNHILPLHYAFGLGVQDPLFQGMSYSEAGDP